MTDDRTKEIQERLGKITPGPWHLRKGFADWNLPMEHEIYRSQNPETERDCVAIVPSIMPNAIGAQKEIREYAAHQDAVSQLIVHAPSDIEWLLKENDSLRTALSTARAEALEEAAKVADATHWLDDGVNGRQCNCDDCVSGRSIAKSIRSLITKEPNND
jgi:hypothetical protein